MKIGIDSYCFHRLFGEVYPFQDPPDRIRTVDEFIDFAKGLDVDGVSLETCFLPSLEGAYLKDLGAKLKEYGLDSVFAWGHPNGLERGLSPEAVLEMKDLIPKTRLLGTDVMRITGSAFDWRHENHRDHLERLVPLYKEAARIAEDHGVKLAAENHIDYTADEMLEMVERVGSKNFGVNFDTGNFLRLLDDPIAGMEKLAPYVFSTHIKDLKMHPTARPNDWFFFCGVPVGFGLIDNMKLAELLHKAGYQGFLAVEIDAPAPEWLNMEEEAIAISVKNLRKIGNAFN
ncbi:MAG: sugar phosphate isomerase/epimerase [Eubacteriales bacterium]|jgi:sugar phosphate isomerase/epimerase|nr:sugar phosphate isomerase/epimerase [Eubacteriales bacterium]MDD3572649.1 sugar phosphate isomerase/epimerase [Eubacteriales bacterium]MDD4134483.1 sugar phosphate isomerase/epimerase [Eubacteriales bacterium]NLO13777.1 sugar phosphate isomerase/epimerase [Clostridiales bacterium]